MFWRKKKKQTELHELNFKERVKAFWDWYAESAARFYDSIEEGNCSELQPELTEAMRKLGINSWVFGPGPEEKGGHSLTLSGEGDLNLQFLTQYWRMHAPDIDGWTFYSERQPGNAGAELAIAIADKSFRFGEVWVSINIDEEHEVIDIVVWHHFFNEVDDSVKQTVSFLILDEVLGEFGTDNWIGTIAFSDDKLSSAIPILELRDTILDIEINKGWKKYPPTETYSNYTIQPLEASFRRSDIFTGTTSNFKLIREYIDAEGELENPIDGTGAHFAYISFDISTLPKGQQVDYRSDIEDHIDQILRTESNGSVIGGATGHENAYIDMLLFDDEASIPLIQKALQEKNLPSGTSIHYFEKNKPTHRVIL